MAEHEPGRPELRRFFPAALVLTLALAATVPAVAHDPSDELADVQSEISALNKKISQAQASSRQVAAELNAASKRVGEVQSQLAEAQGRVDSVRLQISENEAAVEALNARIVELQRKLAETQTKIRATLSDLEIQAVEMYMNASSAMGVMMLEFESASELAVGLAYTSDLASNSEDLIDTFEALRADETRQKEDVDEQKAGVEATLVRLDGERATLEADVARVEELRLQAEDDLAEARKLLNRIYAEINAAEEHKDGLEADAARLEREIAARASSSGTRPGVLSWPVSGRLTSSFGYRIHPIFGTKRLHTGIDLAASTGTPIRAAGPGEVILAETYGGYGRAVVIDHGGGLTTLYAHQSSIAVSRGDTVITGETIGNVGCTGYCTGPHLHFETRENGTPVDPLKYLNG